MFTFQGSAHSPRRGVTLIEMLVVVALVILMMVILVQVFQSALGAMSASKTSQELDVVLRSIDSMIRSDLAGVTARMTPPNNPSQNQGYFEYGENAPADLQGEDSDDFLAFTTRAADGRNFTGRQWLVQTVNGKQMINQTIQPATISSQTAEVIYFVRNESLYRRLFLVAPERKASISQNGLGLKQGVYQTSMFGNSIRVSWQGMNEISCRPGGYFAPNSGPQTPIPNTLGDLTNRENRAFRPRFLNDFTSSDPNFVGQPDGIPDDSNSDGVPDYYPTLYYDGSGWPFSAGWSPNQRVLENPSLPYPRNNQRIQQRTGNSWDVYAFPFIYPGMYSMPDPNRLPAGNPLKLNLGWVHYLSPSLGTGYLNHSPLDLGEAPGFTPSGTQTWWGFPTWRETMAGRSSPAGLNNTGPGWADPIYYVTNNGQQQASGLKPFNPAVAPSPTSPTFLPPVTTYGTGATPYGFDGAGSPFASTNFLANTNAPSTVWQDDLILTNVRSFDVKAYDPYAPLYSTSVGTPLSAGYWDLGYAGLSPGTYAPNYGANSTIYGVNGSTSNPLAPGATAWQALLGEPRGFGHEGRIPPILNDFRLDPRRGGVGLINPTRQPSDQPNQLNNIGDDSPGVIRLTHTFDTWSTDYVYAPDSDIVLWESSTSTVPVYPAFPPPYPTPLRGIQIQIRVTDPRNERTKTLTIRFDFTDKL
jgi:type II secretory pathway component PulJ